MAEQTLVRESIPTVGAVAVGLNSKQNNISGHAANVADSVLTDSTADGVVNKRAIYDGSTTYAAATDANKIATAGFVETKQNKILARATKINDDDQSFAPSVVTNGTTDGDVGQMAILTGTRVAEDGSDGNGFADYTNADSLIPTAAAVRAELANKANHMTCAGWPDSVPVNQRTNANCWLWDKN